MCLRLKSVSVSWCEFDKSVCLVTLNTSESVWFEHDSVVQWQRWMGNNSPQNQNANHKLMYIFRALDEQIPLERKRKETWFATLLHTAVLRHENNRKAVLTEIIKTSATLFLTDVNQTQTSGKTKHFHSILQSSAASFTNMLVRKYLNMSLTRMKKRQDNIWWMTTNKG